MKNIFLIAAGLLMMAFQPLMAQTIDEEISLVQEAFGKDKKVIIETSMDLPEAMVPAFWAVYDEYETARLANGRERVKIINNYLESFANLGEAEADALALRSLKNDVELAKQHSFYCKKFKKATSALQAAKFIQIDPFIHYTIRNAMQQELPFIGEN